MQRLNSYHCSRNIQILHIHPLNGMEPPRLQYLCSHSPVITICLSQRVRFQNYMTRVSDTVILTAVTTWWVWESASANYFTLSAGYNRCTQWRCILCLSCLQNWDSRPLLDLLLINPDLLHFLEALKMGTGATGMGLHHRKAQVSVILLQTQHKTIQISGFVFKTT